MSARERRARIVFVTRKTPLTALVERHGTLAQARFYLRSRGQDSGPLEEAHARFEQAWAQAQAALAPDRRRTRVEREQLDRFLFAPDDVVVVVGQDGLVANAAKYLSGQLTLGVNPDPARYDGILCPHAADALPALLAWLDVRGTGAFVVEERAMVQAEREDGQRLLALNEIFVGHRTHQSARYRIVTEGRDERHSSSGLICASGTGATGWARSIGRQRGLERQLPRPDEPRLVWLVREPFPSVDTETELDFGLLDARRTLTLISEMTEDGVVFGDGIEADRIEFLSGQTVRLRLAPDRLHLVVPAGKHERAR